MLHSFYEYMEFEKCASREEVPEYDCMIQGLKKQFGSSLIKQNLNHIQAYFRYMVLREHLEFLEWRRERYGDNS